MRSQSILLVVLALVFSGSTALGVRQFLMRGPKGAKADSVTVVVAASDIPSNTTLTESLVTTKDFPRELVPPGAILSLADALDRSSFTAIVAGEPLLESKLGPKGQYGLAPKIPKGMRAFTINTPNVASGVAGFILPGNKVDVLLTITQPGDDAVTGGGSTSTLLQNVEILAVDQKLDAPAENKVDTKELRSVTLLVTPQQAGKLDLGQNRGTLHLSLRNPEDTASGPVSPTTLRDILNRPEAAATPWDERIKAVFKSLGETMARAKPVAPSAPAPPPLPPAPERRIIRTIKGGAYEGVVVIESSRRPERGDLPAGAAQAAAEAVANHPSSDLSP